MINRQLKLITNTRQAGVKQGCMLSPTLFNFYLSDLPIFLNTASSTDIMLSDKYIYYKDTSVLLENIPLVKFIKTTSGTQVVYFP